MNRITDEYKNEKNRLLNYIKRSVSSEEDAQDILQDVFVSAVYNFNTLESITNISSWLYTVAKNRIIDLFKKKRPIRQADYGSDVNLEELITDSGLDIEDKLTEEWVMEEIELAIKSLPTPQREVFIMHELKGYSFKEISEKTGTSVNTLLSRKRYAIQNLRVELAEIYDDLYNEEF